MANKQKATFSESALRDGRCLKIRGRKSSTTPFKQQKRFNFDDSIDRTREREKLISVEARKVLAVLDDTIMGLHIVARFPAICDDLEIFRLFFDRKAEAAFTALRSDLKLAIPTGNYEPICSASSEADYIDEFADEMPYALNPRSINVACRLRSETKKIVDLFLRNRRLFTVICMDATPSPSIMELIINLQELRKFMFERLMTTTKAELNEMKFLNRARENESKHQIQIEKLTAELIDLKSKGNEQLKDLKTKIRRLEDDIEKMVTLSSEAILQRRMDVAMDLNTAETLKKEGRIIQEKELLALKKQYLNDLNQHCEEEKLLRQRNYNMDRKLELWIKQYDKDMFQRMNYLEGINFEYAKQKEELKSLEEEFIPVEKSYQELMQDRAIKEALRLNRLEEERRRLGAIMVLQKYLRGWIARRQLLFMKTKAKGKKKKTS